jgi:hypothetical protein
LRFAAAFIELSYKKPLPESSMNRELAEQITKLPDHYEVQDKSTVRLLREAGLPDRLKDLSMDDIETALRQSPKLTDKWIKRGSEQRLGGGWGIEREGEIYRIYSFGGGQMQTEQNRFRACALFILRYVQFISDVESRLKH